MRREVRDRWVNELRSGNHVKNTGRLKRGDTYCVLGVLAGPTLGMKWGDYEDDWVYSVLKALLGQRMVTKLYGINDDPISKYTFRELADIVEAEVPVED